MFLSRQSLLLLLLSCATLLAGCLATPVVVPGDIEPGLTTWQGQVRIVGDVEVPVDAQVVVLPGTEIIFMPPGKHDRFHDHPHFSGSELIVRGRFTAHGTAQQPIVFRHQDSSAARGSWGGVNIMSSPYASFAFCLFTQADSALHSQNSEVFIEESIFRDNKVAIRFNNSNILIENNLLQGNGAGIRFHFGAPVICNNLLVQNGKGLFITSSPRDYHVRDNVFVANSPYHVAVGETVSDNVDLSGNWWQQASEPRFGESFFDRRRDPDLGAVVIEPRLVTRPIDAGPSWNR